VVAKEEWHNGELFPRPGFIVTNFKRPAKPVVRFWKNSPGEGTGPAEAAISHSHPVGRVPSRNVP